MQGGEDCLIKQNQGKLNAVHVAIDFIISCAIFSGNKIRITTSTIFSFIFK